MPPELEIRPRPASNGAGPDQPKETIAQSPESALQRPPTPFSAPTAMLALVAIALVSVGFTAFSPRSAPETQTAAVPAISPFANVSIGGKSAIVIDMQSGKTLYEKNADVPLPLASLTKVALALAVAEALPLDSVMTIPYYAAGTSKSDHFSKGERWRISDIIDFTLVASSNSGAGILAGAANDAIHERYPQSPEKRATLWRMNDLAKSLGLQHTFFLNVSGLDLSSTQAGAYGSARDLAILFAYAASAEPSLFAGTARDGVLLTAPNGQRASASNTNDSQGTISGLIMGKTGLTDLAGGNLAIVFDIGLAHPVVAVVLGSTEDGRFHDMKKLVQAARRSIGEVP